MPSVSVKTPWQQLRADIPIYPPPVRAQMPKLDPLSLRCSRQREYCSLHSCSPTNTVLCPSSSSPPCTALFGFLRPLKENRGKYHFRKNFPFTFLVSALHCVKMLLIKGQLFQGIQIPSFYWALLTVLCSSQNGMVSFILLDLPDRKGKSCCSYLWTLNLK